MGARSKLLVVLDWLLMFLLYPSAWVFKIVRAGGYKKLPRCKSALVRLGVFPIRNHYYEPQFDFRMTKTPFSSDRFLPGIDFNVDGQIDLLSKFNYSGELAMIPRQKSGELEFFMDNGLFESGDAEFWYNLVRLKKPSKIFEIGSGNSTLIAARAIRENVTEDAQYKCKHVCVEPYEMPWLEQFNTILIRQKVEDLPIAFFAELGKDDILFVELVTHDQAERRRAVYVPSGASDP